MIYDNIEFHNVAELEEVKGMPGLRLQRFPKEVRDKLGHLEHERGRFYSKVSVGCEIRFVTAAKFFRISLSSLEADSRIFIYKGNFLHSSHVLKAGVINTLHIEEPAKWNDVEQHSLNGYAFSSKVWRVMFGKDSCIVFHDIDSFGHCIRIPEREEVPRVKWLAYGSSITFGGDTTVYTNAYVPQTARRLKVDVLNKGIAGSCFCDSCISEYIAEDENWDFATLELGVNMRGRFTKEEFEARARNLITSILDKNRNKPVFVISIFPNGAIYSLSKKDKISESNFIFNEISRKIVKEISSPNLYYIDGKEILTDYSGLSTDLLHPSDHGHINMGENLYYKLRPIIEKLL
jgi:lysophospholipase L1-like esterase